MGKGRGWGRKQLKTVMGRCKGIVATTCATLREGSKMVMRYYKDISSLPSIAFKGCTHYCIITIAESDSTSQCRHLKHGSFNIIEYGSKLHVVIIIDDSM